MLDEYNEQKKKRTKEFLVELNAVRMRNQSSDHIESDHIEYFDVFEGEAKEKAARAEFLKKETPEQYKARKEKQAQRNGKKETPDEYKARTEYMRKKTALEKQEKNELKQKKQLERQDESIRKDLEKLIKEQEEQEYYELNKEEVDRNNAEKEREKRQKYENWYNREAIQKAWEAGAPERERIRQQKIIESIQSHERYLDRKAEKAGKPLLNYYTDDRGWVRGVGSNDAQSFSYHYPDNYKKNIMDKKLFNPKYPDFG